MPFLGVTSGFRRADRGGMPSEAASKRRRGRPRVFSEEALRQAARFSYARSVRTRRGAQDLVYRKFAVATLELYREAFPEKASELAWLLEPSPRHSLLSELGRIARPSSDEQGVLRWSAPEVSQLIRAAFMVAEAKPRTKDGVAMIREFRRRADQVSS